MSLNPKQAAFVREYLKDFNATQAAIRAGYSQKTAKEQGSRLLLTNVHVKAAVKKGQEKAAEKAEITAEWVRDKLVDLHAAAMEEGDFAPANKALELLGRHIGMFKDKLELSGSVDFASALEAARNRARR
jgi:phage terminase small subunit